MQPNPPLTNVLEKARKIELRTRKAVEEQLAGGYRSVFRGRGMDFDEVREYAPGDDVRAIDWNVTARSGRPFIKKFLEERELTILLAVDISASGDFGSGETSKRELAAEIASVLALAAMQSRDKVGLVLFSDRVERFIPPRSGHGHVLRLVYEILGTQPQHGGTDIAGALDFINTITHHRTAVFVISDFHTHGGKEAGASLTHALELTGHRHDLTAVWLHDPHELQLPDVGVITMEDAETGEVVELDTSRKKVRRLFRDTAMARHDELRKRLYSSGAGVINIDVAKEYVPSLMRFFAGPKGRLS